MAGVMQLRLISGTYLTEGQERLNALYRLENDIRKDMARIQESCVNIGYRLLDIERQYLYNTVYCQVRGDFCKNVYEYALQELELSKTTTFNLMAVAKAFGAGFIGLKEEYREYSFSQLVELLSFPKEFLPYAKPSMSVKNLRLLKKGEGAWYRDEHGSGRVCSIPKEVLQTVKEEDASSVIMVAAEMVETVQALPAGENHSDVGISSDILPNQIPMQSELYVDEVSINRSDVGTAGAIKQNKPLDVAGMVCESFADEIEFSRWYYANYDNLGIYPLTIIYPADKTVKGQ